MIHRLILIIFANSISTRICSNSFISLKSIEINFTIASSFYALIYLMRQLLTEIACDYWICFYILCCFHQRIIQEFAIHFHYQWCFYSALTLSSNRFFLIISHLPDELIFEFSHKNHFVFIFVKKFDVFVKNSKFLHRTRQQQHLVELSRTVHV